ncbi:MAG: hypothetical protein ABI625_06800 [bacterium]
MPLPITSEPSKALLLEDVYVGPRVTFSSCGTEVQADTTTLIGESPAQSIAERAVSPASQRSLQGTKTRERIYRLIGLGYLAACVWFFARHYVFGGPS